MTPVLRPLLEKVIQNLAAETGGFQVDVLTPPTDEPGEVSWKPDAVVTLRPLSGPPVALSVAIRSRLNPAEALPLVARMAQGPRGTPLLFCPSVSPRVAEICRERGVGFLDAAGNCRIAAPGLFVQFTGKPGVKPDTRPAVDAFAPRSSRIVRRLLTGPLRGWQVQELAREAKVSLGLASKVKHALVEEAFVVEQGRRLHVPDPERLLREWRGHYDPNRGGETRIQLSVPLLEVERRLAEACEGLGVGYALTQFSGASRTAPSVKPSRATIYLADRAEAVFAALKWRPAERGGNVAVWAPYDESVFWGATEVEGLAVVSPLQLYLDLSAGGEEGQAAAEVILRDKIAPAWGLNHAGSTAEESCVF